MKWLVQSPFALVVALLVVQPRSALALTDWLFSVPSSDSGDFQSSETTTSTEIQGSMSRLGNGFIKFTVTNASGEVAPANGSVKFGIELPGYGLFGPAMLDVEHKFVASVSLGECPKKTWSGIFAYALWQGSSGATADTSSASTPAFGIFTWNPGTNTLTVSDVRNLTSYATLAGFASFNLPGTCSNGTITLSGTGDRGGSLRVGALEGGIFSTTTSRYMFVTPQHAIANASALNGTYSSWVFDDSLTTNSYPLSIAISGGTSGTGDEITNIETGTTNTARTWSFSGITINSPFNGAFTANLSLEGSAATKMVCATYFSKKTVFFCAAQNPSDPAHAVNLVMRSGTAGYAAAALDTYNFGSATGKVLTTMGATVTSGGRIVLESSGRIVQGGVTATALRLAQYHADGSLDTSFGTSGRVVTSSAASRFGGIAKDTTGRVLVSATDTAGTKMRVLRYTSQGTLDTSFGTSGVASLSFGTTDTAYQVLVDSNNRILVAGTSYPGSGVTRGAIARLSSTGALDTTYNATGKQTFTVNGSDVYLEGMGLQADGKLVVGGDAGRMYVARFSSAGAIDTAFGSSGRVILSTATTTSAYGLALAVQPDQKVLMAGSDETGTGNYNFVVVRLTSTGSYDTSFNTTGYAFYTVSTQDDWLNAIAVAANQKIIAAGSSEASGKENFAVLRLTSTGARDTTFGTNGLYTIDLSGESDDSAIYSVWLQSDEKILAGGTADRSTMDFGLLRLWP